MSTGGGIMTVKDNWPYLHTGLIIWLDLPVGGPFDRIPQPHQNCVRVCTCFQLRQVSVVNGKTWVISGAELTLNMRVLWLVPQPDDIVKRMQASGEIEKRPLLKQASPKRVSLKIDSSVFLVVLLFTEVSAAGLTRSCLLNWSQAADPVQALKNLYEERKKNYGLVRKKALHILRLNLY